MRIGVLAPNKDFLNNLHRWAIKFIQKNCERELDYESAKIYSGDAIVCFNGRPDLPNSVPPKEFKGLKFVHLQDHVFRPVESLKNLLKNNVDYLLCYNRHDSYDPFFKEYYKNYIDKVIAVPFGYNEIRFKNFKPFDERLDKVIALGAVNPVNDPLCSEDIREFAKFYKNEEWTHKWRRMLLENKDSLFEQMDSLLPVFPETKRFDYDIVKTYNNYKMFVSCESIMMYPSVKTFEGMACGCVLVCSDHPCYKSLGLQDGVTCIMHKQYDLQDFKRKVNYYLHNNKKLEDVSKNGEEFVRNFYSPDRIAQELFIKMYLILMERNL